ncbi:type II secretion system F family protein [Amnibacterium flavum]|uniref:type II secretion system F family protein n=1 Tax=Amnibacterium flavum TaxID=2173173 RepID=UPI0014021BB7|nr:type II secretion system F family protein [Amnibacterium flavum]
MSRQRQASRTLSALAADVERAATLLTAGVPASSAMADLTRSDPQSGGGVPDAQAAVAAALAVAEVSGSPLARTLRDVSASLTSLADAAREIEVASVGPRMTALFVSALPLAGIVLAAALGFGVLDVLIGSPVGRVCLVGGLGLGASGALWSRRLIRHALPHPSVGGLVLDLVAIGLLGGLPPEGAIHLAGREAAARGLDPGGADRARAVVALGQSSGAPVAALLRGEAMLIRREQAIAARIAAERLAHTLLLPLGLCVLPAFLLLGVVPALIAVVSSTVAAG